MQQMKSLFLTLVLSVYCINIQAQSYKSEITQLDGFIQESIKKWQPPGLAVTVVKNGEIVFTKAYGITNINTKTPVDKNTLFGCMSTTKAFVAAGLAMLVDDGKLDWEDKVIKHVPEFQLKDPYVTRELTIIDLLTHRSGLGNSDYLWSMMTISGDSAIYKLREIDLSYSLRSSFIYQNLMYHTAGKVIEAISGQTWGEFLDERIYTPLGMNNTYALLGDIQGIQNKADAHYMFDDDIVQTQQMSVDKAGAAGSMWSSIDDIGKWIQFLLNEGRIGNDTLITQENFKMLFKPHQIIPAHEFYPTRTITKPNWMTYGLGWFQHDYKGKMVQFHTGSLPGMVAIAGMIPEDEVGVYVMGNLDHVELRHAIMYAVFDLFTEGELSRNWSDQFYALYHPDLETPKEPKPISGTTPDFSENEMLGKYYNTKYGWIDISKANGELKFNMNNTVYGNLSHWHYNVYQCTFDRKYWGKTMVNFRLGTSGKISYLETLGERFYLEN